VAILQKLNLAVNDVLREASTQSQLAALQTEFRIGDRADAADYFRRDVAQWKTMITRIGLTPQ
jgi:alpha-D-ribose 1-methylphosphonate 5-triphosphate synthase subunit PhnI